MKVYFNKARGHRLIVPLCCCTFLLSASAAAQTPSTAAQDIARELPALLQVYQHFHRHPELSLHEIETARRFAAELRQAGVDVTEQVGGAGVVGVYRNGPGPVVMIRCDLDALPVAESTGLPYASTVTTVNQDGIEVGVMHACGHDVHMTCAIGVGRILPVLKSQWSGTLIIIGQPAEEIGAGARAMLNDGLYTRFPRPDFVLGFHVDALLEAGKVSVLEGYVYASATSVDITFYGKGGHGALPHLTIDPIVMAARFITGVQTIITREISASDPAVITVGSIHGGSKHNIIPDQVQLQLTIRSYKDTVMQHLLEGIKRMAEQIALSARAPKAPEVRWTESLASVYNDPVLTKTVREALIANLGTENMAESEPAMVSEDFAYYGLAGVPACDFRLGTISRSRLARAGEPGNEPLPGLHNAGYYPDPEPAVKTGIQALVATALKLFSK